MAAISPKIRIATPIIDREIHATLNGTLSFLDNLRTHHYLSIALDRLMTAIFGYIKRVTLSISQQLD
jgi:hypothetical protein